MTNSISIVFPDENSPKINVFYTVEVQDNLKVIYCRIESKGIPIWLQLRKFSFSALISADSSLVPLYNEENNSKNLDTAMFIDAVYQCISNVAA